MASSAWASPSPTWRMSFKLAATYFILSAAVSHFEDVPAFLN